MNRESTKINKTFITNCLCLYRPYISRGVSPYPSPWWRTTRHGWASHGSNGVTILAGSTMTSRLEQHKERCINTWTIQPGN